MLPGRSIGRQRSVDSKNRAVAPDVADRQREMDDGHDAGPPWRFFGNTNHAGNVSSGAGV